MYFNVPEVGHGAILALDRRVKWSICPKMCQFMPRLCQIQKVKSATYQKRIFIGITSFKSISLWGNNLQAFFIYRT